MKMARRLRLLKEKTVIETAEATAIGYDNLIAFERDQRTISGEKLIRLARYLEVEPEDLLKEDPVPLTAPSR